MKRVLCFGVFDGLHDGHRFFLRQARALGDHLIVAVAQDVIVERLKNKTPHNSLEARMKAIKKERLADEVVSGDATIGDWGVIRAYKPDIIAIGHDQHQLKLELETYIKRHTLSIQIIVMTYHHRK